MKHIALLTCVCGLMLLGSCKKQSAQNEQPLEVMTLMFAWMLLRTVLILEISQR